MLGYVGVLIALGAMLGKLLADSGGADQVVDTLLRGRSGTLPWKMALIAFIIGIPMFFEIGLVLLIPVVMLTVRRTGRPALLLGIPALAGLSVLHGFVPPHPGPLAAIAALHANVGFTLALGLVIAIPTVIVAGPLFGKLAARMVPVGASGAGLAVIADAIHEPADALADDPEARLDGDPPAAGNPGTAQRRRGTARPRGEAQPQPQLRHHADHDPVAGRADADQGRLERVDEPEERDLPVPAVHR